MNPILLIILQAQGAPGGGMANLVMILLIVVIFYFFMIRPQMKKAKLERQFKETLQKGDKVITIGGIHGKIVEIADTSFLVEIDSNVKVRLEKSAVSAEATKAYRDRTEGPKK